MSENNENISVRGDIHYQIQYADGRPPEDHEIRNVILRSGRNALARALANDVGDQYEFYISRMLFGNGGTHDGVPRFVDDGRNGLYGITILSKGVIPNVDPSMPTQVVFTSVVAFSEANNTVINEMALQMGNGDLYSMKTFPDLNKTNQMQIVFNWRISFI